MKYTVELVDHPPGSPAQINALSVHVLGMSFAPALSAKEIVD
jgi:hypothetical protein